MAEQKYEKYWELTVEYTDINEDNFIGTLKIIVDFIDSNDMSEYKKSLYKELQEQVYDKYPKSDMGSVRKSINQFIKLGFINNQLKSYHKLTKDFLDARTKKKRKNLFSNIFYSNSKLSSATTKPSELKQINFLIRTLEEVGKLTKKNIEGLMTVDIARIEKGYLTEEEVKEATSYATKIGFVLRKYNQVGYLFNFLGKLNDIVFVNDELYFEDDAKQIFGDELSIKEAQKRDPYLHRLYKNQLKEESEEYFETAKCMVENLSYPSLVASHIKPFIKSNENEAYDPNNGILLSRNIDSLFDLGYITFKDNGEIIFATHLKQDVKDFISNYSLDNRFINAKRLEYLEYHRNEVFQKRYNNNTCFKESL